MRTLRNAKELKTPYERPLIEVLDPRSESVLAAASWNSGEGGNMPVIPGDPDPGDDGKGAKENLWDGHENIWD